MLYDVIIIGGGVSGLLAAECFSLKRQKVLVVERGKNIYERNRDNRFDVANGIGGAGLFSDGKLSMFPSATNLWKLRKDDLKTAYSTVEQQLDKVGVSIEAFSDEWAFNNTDVGMHKCYDSIPMNIEQRMKFIFMLCQVVGSNNILTNSEVTKIEKINNLYYIEVCNNKEKSVYQTRTLIIAGGKHCFQRLMERSKNISYKHKKYVLEFGFRIECSNDEFDYYENDQMDIKLIDNKSDKSIRTFCCCRDGIIIESSSYDLQSLNGSSSDSEKTGRTNIGVLIKIEGKEAEVINNNVRDILISNEKQNVSLNSFINDRSSIFGYKIDSLLRTFIVEQLPKMSKGTGVIFFPTIEKDGYYPVLNDVLQVPSEDIWVVGDAAGLFRGLLSSMVSGIIAANRISNKVQSYERDLREKLHIKMSDTKDRKVIFTAQSKQYFYCRDAVCEFVLRNGCIPVNPFRLFDYFLGDRVDRDLIRNGNNEMIKRCDEMWVFGMVSDGVLFEIYMCQQMGKAVKFFNIATRSEEIRELKEEDIIFEPEIHSYQLKKGELLSFIKNKNGLPPVVQLGLELDE